MNTFELHKEITNDYKSYISSFINIKDDRIRQTVEGGFDSNSFLPEPLIQFNPAYKKGNKLLSLISEQVIHPDLDRIFKGYELYKHQEEAIRIGANNKGFVVTSGTGSGKSLTYLASIFNHVINNAGEKSIKAIIVYPMNALINSQEEEIYKYEINYLAYFLTPGDEWNKEAGLKDQIKELKTKVKERFPITYAKYTGQEKEEEREKIREKTPDIILTNYMMLELIMTRQVEAVFRDSMIESLQYLVFDELHTYRGRQGADVSMLIRRIQAFCKKDLTTIGTSATMATGSLSEQKKSVAKVAGIIYGKHYEQDQVITETLVYSTNKSEVKTQALIDEINRKDDYPLDDNIFQANPLAIWIEQEFALETFKDGYISRRKPIELSKISKKLADVTGCEVQESESAIIKVLLWGEQLNIEVIKRNERKSFLPFKIHQFISQTGTVYVTLDKPEERQISLDEERYIVIDNTKRYLYSLLFSRYSGHEFICVELDVSTNKIKPRQTNDYNESLTQSDFKERKRAGLTPTLGTLNKGYIVFDKNEEPLWTSEMIEELPGSWYTRRKDGTIKINDYHSLFLPHPIYFNELGEYSLENQMFSNQAWYIPTGMLFDPTAGIIYDSRTAENTKLMRLGNEGRSTAATMTAISVLKALQNQNEERKKQKLLSFTDNRQDASLQAGHFNDFVTIVRLRSSIFHALNNSDNKSLTITEIAKKAKNELGLLEKEFARRPTIDENIPNKLNQEALEKYIFLRILYDLKRGWRYILPNLELSGLLSFEFADIKQIAEKDVNWSNDLLFKKLSETSRIEIIEQILHYFRQLFAIDHRFFDQDELEKNENLLKDNLDPDKIWSLDSYDTIERPNTLFLSQIPDILKRRVFFASAGPRSKIGKYIKRIIQQHANTDLESNDLAVYIENLFEKLTKYHFLVKEEIKHGEETYVGYKLNTQKLIWKLGDGEKLFTDQINNYFYKEINLKPNKFFNKFYQQRFNKYQANLIGKEHTGQINKEERIQREDGFRKGNIAALFCSPTMELGIDISELNVVHLRNTPPSPANYAQRSGRAGRSGQTALVLNYCALGSPHDRHYFHNSLDMVSGVVVPPRIDLLNKELLHAQINAYLFMEMRLESIKSSAKDVLNLQDRSNNYPLVPDISNVINDQISRRRDEFFKNIMSILASFSQELEKTNWFNDKWIIGCIDNFLLNFDKTFDRWRTLFQNALDQRDRSQIITNDYTLKESHPSKKEARKLSAIANKQIQLLLNNEETQRGESEFYIFRYLASEGFFPGYNFIRLPIRSFLGKRNEGGVYISRPRFIALREFGPQNLIYHNGNKYRINSLILQNNQFENNQRKMKVCLESGYAYLNNEGDAINNDPITNQPLDGGDRVQVYTDLIEVAETNAYPQDRISSQEEERVRMGYDIGLYFSFPEGPESAQKIIIKNKGEDLLNLWFYKAANIIEVNHKWKSSREDGFLINKSNGKFEQQRHINDENRNQMARARLFTSDTSDMILLQPVEVLGLSPEGVISMAFALKRAIERFFQVEESEIGIHIVGSHDVKNILIYEASEGSLGILSQIAEDNQLLRELFTEAYRVCQYDPVTKKDLSPDLGPATYKDLLSYYNQIYHDQLDRHAIADALELLMECETENSKYFGSRQENLNYLYDNYDKLSKLELHFIKALEKYEGKLPNKAQVNLSDIANTYASADFVYTDEKILVFIDGNVHDREEIANADYSKRKALRNAGYKVVVWNYKQPVESFLKEHKHIFMCKKI